MKSVVFLLLILVLFVCAELNPLDLPMNDPALEQFNDKLNIKFQTPATAQASLDSYHGLQGVADHVDVASAKVFVTVAAASYCTAFPTTALEDWTCAACKDSGVTAREVTRLYVPETDGSGYVAYLPIGGKNREELIVVSFRGSRSIQNWMTNLDFWKTPYQGCSGCEVHKGFLYSYSLLRPQMVAAVAKLAQKYPNAKVSITGHSLGGALALHALSDLQGGVFTLSSLTNTEFVHTGHPDYDTSISPAQLRLLGAQSVKVAFKLAAQHHTYGQPRIGNSNFIDWFQSLFGATVMRHTHWSDPVPHLPPIAFGYAHNAREIWWNQENSAFTECSEKDGEDSNCSNSIIPIGFDQHMKYCGYAIPNFAGSC